jgi:hypothetical protein
MFIRSLRYTEMHQLQLAGINGKLIVNKGYNA